jgi:aryl-alcohol dehydrogenase-like predicted oxidoreductase
LNTDRIDLYQLHVPDADTPVEDTLAALDKLVGAGKVRAIGCSNFSAEQIDEAMKASDSRGTASFASVQNHYSLLHREPEKEVTDACERHGLGLLPYFPLASGLLTGKYTSPNDLPKGTRLQLMAELAPERAKRFLSDENFDIVGRLRSFCEERSRTMLELAFSWLLAQPVVPSVIAGATSADQVRANVAASGWELGSEDLDEIDNLTRGA